MGLVVLVPLKTLKQRNVKGLNAKTEECQGVKCKDMVNKREKAYSVNPVEEPWLPRPVLLLPDGVLHGQRWLQMKN